MNINNLPTYQLINGWSNFIDECIDGYQWDMSEYHHEIRVREYIQTKIENKEISKYLLVKLNSLDKKFKSLLKGNIILPSEKHWWSQGVLKKSGEPYCYYMKSTYNIVVIEI